MYLQRESLGSVRVRVLERIGRLQYLVKIVKSERLLVNRNIHTACDLHRMSVIGYRIAVISGSCLIW